MNSRRRCVCGHSLSMHDLACIQCACRVFLLPSTKMCGCGHAWHEDRCLVLISRREVSPEPFACPCLKPWKEQVRYRERDVPVE